MKIIIKQRWSLRAGHIFVDSREWKCWNSFTEQTLETEAHREGKNFRGFYFISTFSCLAQTTQMQNRSKFMPSSLCAIKCNRFRNVSATWVLIWFHKIISRFAHFWMFKRSGGMKLKSHPCFSYFQAFQVLFCMACWFWEMLASSFQFHLSS